MVLRIRLLYRLWSQFTMVSTWLTCLGFDLQALWIGYNLTMVTSHWIHWQCLPYWLTTICIYCSGLCLWSGLSRYNITMVASYCIHCQYLQYWPTTVGPACGEPRVRRWDYSTLPVNYQSAISLVLITNIRHYGTMSARGNCQIRRRTHLE